MLFSSDSATIAGALTGMAVFLFVWFFAGSRLRLISHLKKPSAERGEPHWSVYVIIAILWLGYTALLDGLPGLAIGSLYLAFVLFVAFACHSLNRLSRKTIGSKALLFGYIGLVGWILPLLGFLLAAGCLYASFESADAKKIRIGIILSTIIIVLSTISFGIGAHKAISPRGEFRNEKLGFNFNLDKAVSVKNIDELIPLADESASYSVTDIGECLEWKADYGNTSLIYSAERKSPPGELLICNETTNWESKLTRAKFTSLSVKLLTDRQNPDGSMDYSGTLTAEMPATARGLKIGDKYERSLEMYGKPLSMSDFPEPLPYKSIQFEDNRGDCLMIVCDQVTEKIIELSVYVAEPVNS